jgi:hypothetical protein
MWRVWTWPKGSVRGAAVIQPLSGVLQTCGGVDSTQMTQPKLRSRGGSISTPTLQRLVDVAQRDPHDRVSWQGDDIDADRPAVLDDALELALAVGWRCFGGFGFSRTMTGATTGFASALVSVLT